MSMGTISAMEFAALHHQGKKLDRIDVRMPSEYREAHFGFAKNIPLDKLDPAAVLQSREAGSEPLYVTCQKGARGNTACQKLAAAGLTSVINVEGGTSAALGTDLPITRGKKAISLERKVRIVAGSLVLLGVLGTYFVHYDFLGLAGFVGAGFVFSGVTDICGMAIHLAKLPWNK